MSRDMENPWGALGLPRGATKLEVKEAYMKLVKEYHPDKHMNESITQRERAEAKFKDVQQAYTLLTSKDRHQVTASPTDCVSPRCGLRLSCTQSCTIPSSVVSSARLG